VVATGDVAVAVARFADSLLSDPTTEFEGRVPGHGKVIDPQASVVPGQSELA